MTWTLTLSQKWHDRLAITAVTAWIMGGLAFASACVFIGVKFDQVESTNGQLSHANHVQIVNDSAGVATLDNDGTYIFIRLNEICAKVECGPAPPLPKQVKPSKKELAG